MRGALRFLPILLTGCVTLSGANPPLVPLATLVDEGEVAQRLGQRVRFYGVLHGYQRVPTPRGGGRRMVAMTLYGVRLEGELPGACDFGVRSGAVTVLVPAEVAQPWGRRPADAVFLMTGRVQRWFPGEPRWSPTPWFVEVDSMTQMDTCPRPDPRVAAPVVGPGP